MNQIAKIPCSVHVLTRNSEKTIGRCLASVSDFAEIIVFDGNSTDRTREIATHYGAHIMRQDDTTESLVAVTDFSHVRNRALHASSYEWCMYIDSDEYLSKEAAQEIRRTLIDTPYHAFWQPRKYVLNGEVIECASTYPNKQMRVFNKKWVRGFVKPIHERIELLPGAQVSSLSGIEFVPLDSLYELLPKLRRYRDEELRMTSGKSRMKQVRFAARHVFLFLKYMSRYVEGLLFCRGTRLPFQYEFKRHWTERSIAFSLLRRVVLGS